MNINKERLLKIIDELSTTYDIDNGVGIVHDINRDDLLRRINELEEQEELDRKKQEEIDMLSLC